MTIGDFVRKRKHLFWSTKNYDGLSKGAVIEAILNYGDMNDVRELIVLLGMQEVSKIFHENTNRARINYDPKIVNYFSLFFKKYA
ncbi:hypothetical protein A3D03_05550 [Candidatus Gottesmanbacteria bacterium RIFCSPHIGHO2_02_FULL_40_13]|uniref:Uncharacterized protein n=1 Tax=Candidatus Gottesmanbacteria bacterium RIFCSPHIGHO2_02_FULL_40_13 TaxID=1798384 RepID=A0A1F6A8A3_9BACT|nr:MAG: hypothetical protein A3D03_05550 [Candidatus Gottesmanbacteria bacterium RIFCSPHIGHO2_02_FULL_40_13]